MLVSEQKDGAHEQRDGWIRNWGAGPGSSVWPEVSDALGKALILIPPLPRPPTSNGGNRWPAAPHILALQSCPYFQSAPHGPRGPLWLSILQGPQLSPHQNANKRHIPMSCTELALIGQDNRATMRQQTVQRTGRHRAHSWHQQ